MKRTRGFKDENELRQCHAKTRKKFDGKMEAGRRCLEELDQFDSDDSHSVSHESDEDLDERSTPDGSTSSHEDSLLAAATDATRFCDSENESTSQNSDPLEMQIFDEPEQCVPEELGMSPSTSISLTEDVISMGLEAAMSCSSGEESSRCEDGANFEIPDRISQAENGATFRMKTASVELESHSNFPSTSQSLSCNDISASSPYGEMFEFSRSQSTFLQEVEENAASKVRDDDPDLADFEEVMTKTGRFSQRFKNLLSLELFSASKTTVKDVLNVSQSIYLRYKIPKDARFAILEMIKILAGPEFKNLNLSKYYVSKFNKPIDEHKMYTFYCTECYSRVSKPLSRKEFNKNSSGKCDGCEKVYNFSTKNDNFYINMNIEYQLRNIFKNEEVFESLLASIAKIQGSQKKKLKEITDVHDGEIYQNKPMPESTEDDVIVLTTSGNADGGKMHNSTLYSLWPLVLLINELPVKLRFRLAILAAALYTSKEPNHHLMNSFMSSFLDQMSVLMHEGMTFFHKTRRKTYRIFVLPLFFILDTVARPILQARKQYNAHYGCSWCYAYGKKIGSMRYLKTDYAPKRTQQEYLKDLEERKKVRRDKNGEKVYRGVRGTSKIAEFLPYFDNVWGYPPEYMHGVLLGVAKQFWEFLNKSSCHFKLPPKDLRKIDERLTSLKPIKSMYRRPCELKKKGKWKAADWLYWLIFYSIPCYRGILNDDVFNSYALFVNSIRLLLSAKIDNNTLNQVEKDLRKFVEDCEEFFGPEFMTFNVHSLLHLVESVRKSGPLWATSAWKFESEIGHYKEFVTGTTNVLEQITNHVLELNEFTKEVLSNPSQDESHEFCRTMMSSEHNVTNHHRTKEGAVVPFCKSELSQNKYYRCIYTHAAFHSTPYTRPQLTDDTHVQLSDGDVAQILFFFMKNQECYAKVQLVDVSQVHVGGTCIDHILLVTGKVASTKSVPITTFDKKMIHLVVMNDLEYVCSPLDVFDAQ